MSNRFDNRTVSTFKKDIKFGTMVEKYFFNKWRDIIASTEGMNIEDWEDNGCGNDGEFIAKGNTAGADYRVSAAFECESVAVVGHPLEMKWVPTAGKFTLKENDLDKYKQLVESKSQQIRWGIMWADKVEELYNSSKENNSFRPINYMGGKSGIVLKSSDFSKWFVEHEWE